MNQLPPDIADFTGRNAQSAQVRDWLGGDVGEDQSTAVVISAIAGKGGVGKTALAVHIAHQVRDRFPDGQLYVNLRGVDARPLDPANVLTEFLRTLGVEAMNVPEGLEDRARLYRARLSDRRVLVVLDNAIDEAQVKPLLPGSAGCAVLVTSRSRLSGLEGAKTIQLDVMEPDHALELLRKVAGPGRVAKEPQNAAELTHLCGYLPLAIRIAGARLATKPHWRLATLVENLQDERRRLGELHAGDLEVRASFAVSYEDLGDDEQHTFRLLGLLSAPDFASWVAAALLDRGLGVAEELVERLVDAQLIEVAGEESTERTRYRFHDLLRVFARERLQEEESATVQQAALKRVLRAYLGLADRAAARLGRDDHRITWDAADGHGEAPDYGLAASVERDPLSWLRTEEDNLVAAVAQAHGAGLWELTWELAGSLSVIFESRAQWNAWEHANELALDAAHKTANRGAEAYTIRNIGLVFRYRGRSKESMAYVDHCLKLFEELGDQLGRAYALLDAGITYRYSGRFDQALDKFRECLSLFESLNNELGAATVRRNIGIISYHRGWFDEAMEYLKQAVTVFERGGAPLPMALTLRHLGIVFRHRGRLDDALECTDRSLSIFRELGNLPGEALLLLSLSEVYRSLDRPYEALSCLEESLPTLRELGDRHGEATALHICGDVYRDQGHLDEALACFRRCLPVLREFGDRLTEADTLLSLGELYHALGRGFIAMAFLDRSLTIFQRLSHRLGKARTLRSKGMLLASCGDHAAAERAWREASKIFLDLGVPDTTPVQASQ